MSTCKRVEAQIRSLGRAAGELAGPFKRAWALPRITRGALGLGWGREGGGALPLPRAAVISTRVRVLTERAELRLEHEEVGLD